MNGYVVIILIGIAALVAAAHRIRAAYRDASGLGERDDAGSERRETTEERKNRRIKKELDQWRL